MFHYAELHVGLEGTLYILSAVLTSGILFGALFFSLNYDEDVNSNNIRSPDDHNNNEKDLNEDEDYSSLKSYFNAVNSLPMILLMISHLFIHFGKWKQTSCD